MDSYLGGTGVNGIKMGYSKWQSDDEPAGYLMHFQEADTGAVFGMYVYLQATQHSVSSVLEVECIHIQREESQSDIDCAGLDEGTRLLQAHAGSECTEV